LPDGIGIEEAVKSYKLTADQGNLLGQSQYGICLQNGIGIEQSIEGAMQYYKLAADDGNDGARERYLAWFWNEQPGRPRLPLDPCRGI
jgi:TPR repeat protein